MIYNLVIHQCCVSIIKYLFYKTKNCIKIVDMSENLLHWCNFHMS